MESHGYVAPGYESVREQFDVNLASVEIGAAFAVYHHGQPVVDLWGGIADAATERPWNRNTSTVIFSGSKGILSSVLLWLCDQRILDLDKPVCHYWPEFSSLGKSHVTVSDFATYAAGVPAIRQQVLGQNDINDPRAMAKLIAQEPITKSPQLIYGPFTLGWILDELCVRTTGLEAREIFRERIANPLGLEFGWGSNAVQDLASVHHDDEFARQYDVLNFHESALVRDIWANPIPFTQGENQWNRPERRDSYIPAANGAGTARSIAKLYSTLIDDLHGKNGTEGVVAAPQSVAKAIDLKFREKDEALGFPFAYGYGGFRRRSQPREGLDGDMFGHDGGGGSAHFAWPAARIALSYTPNRLLDIGNNDHRASSLIRALKESLASLMAEKISL
ncbi:serine hydrolase domain-containing protein [Glutamicibacter sp. TV12E]|uniref:serine hydrolase domain-containing protein n=1 Tax=Glutamicibacter sp. TV12E TaxID=3446362 RepID=UPI004033818A